ncbi:hypothetical protein BSKO_01586 [Bryopsis sp. KO-2023]|nr:hypothetical protein BSKO_01586 [Bryopsis sp. KO-2023]
METTYLDVLAFAVGCKASRRHGLIVLEPIAPKDSPVRSASATSSVLSSESALRMGEVGSEPANSAATTETCHVSFAPNESSKSEHDEKMLDSTRAVGFATPTAAGFPENEKSTVKSVEEVADRSESARSKGRSAKVLFKRMSTIKGDISRKLNDESVEEIRAASDDIEAVQDETTLYVTLPFKATVLFSTLQERVSDVGLAWSDLQIDMQDSILKGDAFDCSKLTSFENCKFTLENGILAVSSILGMRRNSHLANVEVRCPKEVFSFQRCICSLQESKFNGFGVVVNGESKLTMVDCEVTKSKGVGMLVERGCSVSATSCKFVENGGEGVAVQESAKVTLIKCDVIGEGVRVEGQGASATLRESYLMGSRKANVLACGGGTVSMTDTVSYDSQGPGVEAHGKGSSIKMKSCEILNSEDHCVSIHQGAHLNVSNCTCKSSSSGVGLLLMDRGSKAAITDSEFVGNCSGGILVGRKASCMLQGCQLSGSSEGFGIAAEGDVTEVTMLKCTVSENHLSGILLRDGAYATLKDCLVEKSERGYALEATGKGSRAFDTGCRFQGNGVYSSEHSQVIRNTR